MNDKILPFSSKIFIKALKFHTDFSKSFISESLGEFFPGKPNIVF
jgi:hypothetical protein